ncbi:MAG: nucleotide exchange factor GrpE [Anaerolineae bacterium]|nr:nucleotide exchange factor GrpE [Anaerolineae bacterium]
MSSKQANNIEQDDLNHAPEAADAPDGSEAPATEALPLEAELEKVKAEAAEYLEGWQRARAEFANYRKRVEREKEEIYLEARVAVLAKILPVIDDFARAMDNTPEELADHTWTNGVQLIGEKFAVLLESTGLVEINPVGEQFDPARHEAIGMDDSTDMESGHVTMVLQKGYAYGDKVLRPAMVRVAN